MSKSREGQKGVAATTDRYAHLSPLPRMRPLPQSACRTRQTSKGAACIPKLLTRRSI